MSKKIHIQERLTSKKILELLNEHEDLEEISCPKSLYDRISPKYIGALKELNIVVIESYSKKKKSKYNKEQLEEIIKVIKKGKSVKQTSQETKIPQTTIYNIISKHNQKPPKKQIKLKHGPPPKYTTEDVKKIIGLIKKGKSVKQTSQETKIPQTTIYNIISKHNQKPPKKQIKLRSNANEKYGKDQKQKLFEMYKNGIKAKKISEKLDIPLRTVYRYIKDIKKDERDK